VADCECLTSLFVMPVGGCDSKYITYYNIKNSKLWLVFNMGRYVWGVGLHCLHTGPHCLHEGPHSHLHAGLHGHLCVGPCHLHVQPQHCVCVVFVKQWFWARMVTQQPCELV